MEVVVISAIRPRREVQRVTRSVLGLLAVAFATSGTSAYAACDSVPSCADSLSQKRKRSLVTKTFASWNPLSSWRRKIEALRSVEAQARFT
jgi:hypothetical protein